MTTPAPLRLSTSTTGELTTLVVAGPLDPATCPALDAALLECLADRPEALALDMQDVTLLSGAAVSLLIHGRDRALHQDTTWGIVRPSAAVRAALSSVRLLGMLARDPLAVRSAVPGVRPPSARQTVG